MKRVYELGLVVYTKDNWISIQKAVIENNIDGNLKLMAVSLEYIHYGYFKASTEEEIDKMIKLLPEGTQYDPRCRIFNADRCKTIHRFNDFYESHSRTIC